MGTNNAQSRVLRVLWENKLPLLRRQVNQVAKQTKQVSAAMTFGMSLTALFYACAALCLSYRRRGKRKGKSISSMELSRVLPAKPKLVRHTWEAGPLLVGHWLLLADILFSLSWNDSYSTLVAPIIGHIDHILDPGFVVVVEKPFQTRVVGHWPLCSTLTSGGSRSSFWKVDGRSCVAQSPDSGIVPSSDFLIRQPPKDGPWPSNAGEKRKGALVCGARDYYD